MALNALNHHYRQSPSRNASLCQVVVAQLVEWSLPTPEIIGSIPVIGKFYSLLIELKKVSSGRK